MTSDKTSVEQPIKWSRNYALHTYSLSTSTEIRVYMHPHHLWMCTDSLKSINQVALSKLYIVNSGTVQTFIQRYMYVENEQDVWFRIFSTHTHTHTGRDKEKGGWGEAETEKAGNQTDFTANCCTLTKSTSIINNRVPVNYFQVASIWLIKTSTKLYINFHWQ